MAAAATCSLFHTSPTDFTARIDKVIAGTSTRPDEKHAVTYQDGATAQVTKNDIIPNPSEDPEMRGDDDDVERDVYACQDRQIIEFKKKGLPLGLALITPGQYTYAFSNANTYDFNVITFYQMYKTTYTLWYSTQQQWTTILSIDKLLFLTLGLRRRHVRSIPCRNSGSSSSSLGSCRYTR